MIFRKVTSKPFEMTSWFAWHPIAIYDVEDQDEHGKVLTTTYAWFRKVNRRLDKNLSGTFRWVYSLPG